MLQQETSQAKNSLPLLNWKTTGNCSELQNINTKSFLQMHNHIKGKGLKSSFLHMKYGQSIKLENPIAITYKIVNSNPITVVPGPILPH